MREVDRLAASVYRLATNLFQLVIEECGHFGIVGNGAHSESLTGEDRKFREGLCAGGGLHHRLGGLMIAIWANAKKLSNCDAWQHFQITK